MRTGCGERCLGPEQIRGHAGERAGRVVEQGGVVVGEAAGVNRHAADELTVDDFAQLLESVGNIAGRHEARDIMKRERLERRLMLAGSDLGSTARELCGGREVASRCVQPGIGARHIDSEDAVESRVRGASCAFGSCGRSAVARQRRGCCQITQRGTEETAIRPVENGRRFA